MKIIAVIGQKGGAAKTTTAENLAVQAAEETRKPVLLVDLDPQATAAKWGDRRQAKGEREPDAPAVLAVPAARLAQVLATARKQGASFVVLDTPPRSAETSIEAAKVADLVLLPVHPLINDIETLPAIRDLLRVSGDPKAYVLFIDAPVQGTRHQDAEAGAEKMGLQVCPVVLHHRSAYGDAANGGLSVTEFEPEGKAAQEVRELYQFILEKVKG
jgi:chromosome partitioning protein